MALERTEALVLRVLKFGETSKIVTFLSGDFGRIKAIGKGVRAVRPKFGAALDVFARIDLVVYRKQGRDLHLIGQADLIDGHLPLSDDVRRYAFACAAAEFLGRLVSEEESVPEVYAESVDLFRLMATAGPEGLPYLLRAFQVRIVGHLGHTPELARCVVCGADDRPLPVFSAAQGGVVCSLCRGEADGVQPLSRDALRVFRAYLDEPLEAAAEQRLPPAARAELGRHLEAFLSAQFDAYRGLRSLKLAAGLR